MEPEIKYPHGIDDKDIAGAETTQTRIVVARLDAVIKFASVGAQPSIKMEKRVYERLARHDGILRYYGDLGGGIILQYASHGTIRQYLASQTELPPMSIRAGWVQQIVEAIAFMRSKNVLYGEISCNDVFLDQNLNAKLVNLAGSVIDECRLTPERRDLGLILNCLGHNMPSLILALPFTRYCPDRNRTQCFQRSK